MGISDLYKRLVGKEQTKPEANIDLFLRGLNDIYLNQKIQTEPVKEFKPNPLTGLGINPVTGQSILGRGKITPYEGHKRKK
ncbi:hypothetical protein JXA48_03380 [Candidatus Woesearchaeota archaeon]|nr:hypothetical protein [Candidatus Woesearchaeota archaeon]